MGRTPIPNPYRKRNPRDIEDRVRRLEKQYKRHPPLFDPGAVYAVIAGVLIVLVVFWLAA